MRHRWRWIGFLLLLSPFFLVMSPGSSGVDPSGDRLEALMAALSVQALGDSLAAQDFTLPDVVNGGEKSLSEFRGKVVFLNFWATWCPPCRKEMPTMQELYATLQGDGLEILAVSVDRGNREGIVDFVNEFHLTFTVLHDDGMEVARVYRVNAIPTTLIVNRQGEIVGRAVGERDWNSAEAQQLFRLLLCEEGRESC